MMPCMTLLETFNVKNELVIPVFQKIAFLTSPDRSLSEECGSVAMLSEKILPLFCT